MLLAGCASNSAKLPPIEAAAPVELPQECEALLKNQPVVQPKVGDDYRNLFKRAQNGQIVENSVITQTHACLELQRKLYAGTQ